jgi:ribosomal protein S18 acetylase RimI-like enzyme
VSELDNPIWWSLAGRQRHLGTATRLAARFDPAVSPFGAMAGDPTEAHWPTDAHWEELATIAGPGGQLVLIDSTEGAMSPGPGWTVLWELPGLQMVGDRIDPAATATPRGPGTGTLAPEGLEILGREDVGDMLALVADTRPGPFLPRTVEFGGYVGVREEGRLIAMAGERLNPPGHAEVSAVATDPAHRRRGLARRLVTVVAAAIIRRGETPFLHAEATNVDAVRLYRSMGFTERRRLGFVLVQAPGAREGDRPGGVKPRA